MIFAIFALPLFQAVISQYKIENNARLHYVVSNIDSDGFSDVQNSKNLQKSLSDAVKMKKSMNNGIINEDITDYIKKYFVCDGCMMSVSSADVILRNAGFSKLKLIGIRSSDKFFVFRAEKILEQGFSFKIVAYVDLYTKDEKFSSAIKSVHSTLNNITL